MKVKVIITQGLPASGKSTWAKQFCKENKGWVRVNRDDLRNMRGEYWIPSQEDFISTIERLFIKEAIIEGLNVIVDATNLNPKHLNSLKQCIKTGFNVTHVEIEVKSFLDVSVEECIKRDVKRPDSVGEKVIRGMYDKYLAPVVPKQDKSLPKALIVDIDGTLAKMNGRGPFEWTRVKEDSVKEEIKSIVNRFAKTHKIFVFSGRDGSCCKITGEWLTENEIHYDELIMRPEGSNEKDSIVKRRMFDDNIKDKYYIDFVLDDRNQVVDMWRRDLGLTCLQVDYGDF